jgi:hypothetical protein
VNYLRPDIKRGNISPDEEELIIRMHRLLGNRYVQLSLTPHMGVKISIVNGILRSSCFIYIMQVVTDSRTTAWANGQRNQELLEHSFEKKLLMDKCQYKMQNLKTRAESPTL